MGVRVPAECASVVLSENELLGLASKSAQGCGLPEDVAATLASAVLWLERRSWAGVSLLVDELDLGAEGASRLQAVLGAMDWATVDGDRHDISPCCGVLLIGLAGALAHERGGAFELGVTTSANAAPTTIVVDADGVIEVATEQMFDADLGAVGAITVLQARYRSYGNGSLAPRSTAVAPFRVALDPDILARLSAYAARTMVPASEQSRLAGAGAGLTDND